MSAKPTLRERLHERRVRYQRRSKLYRSLYTLAGLVIVATGIGMLVFPGPGLVVIAVGLTMLALEFDWAERLLERVLRRVEQARASTDRISKKYKVAATLGTLIVVVGASVAAFIYRDELLRWADRIGLV